MQLMSFILSWAHLQQIDQRSSVLLKIPPFIIYWYHFSKGQNWFWIFKIIIFKPEKPWSLYCQSQYKGSLKPRFWSHCPANLMTFKSQVNIFVTHYEHYYCTKQWLQNSLLVQNLMLPTREAKECVCEALPTKISTRIYCTPMNCV